MESKGKGDFPEEEKYKCIIMSHSVLSAVHNNMTLTLGSKASGDVAKTLDGCRTTKDLAYDCDIGRWRGYDNE